MSNNSSSSSTTLQTFKCNMCGIELNRSTNWHTKTISLYRCDSCLIIARKKYNKPKHNYNAEDTDPTIISNISDRVPTVLSPVEQFHAQTQNENQSPVEMALKNLGPIIDAARDHVILTKEIQRKIDRPLNRKDKQRIDTFGKWLKEEFAIEGAAFEVINRIFDKNEINTPELGYEIAEMALALIIYVAQYRHLSLYEAKQKIHSWIQTANKYRPEWDPIHSTDWPREGYGIPRWHITKRKEDFDSQLRKWGKRIKSSINATKERKIEKDRAIKEQEAEAKQKQEEEQQQIVITVKEESQ